VAEDRDKLRAVVGTVVSFGPVKLMWLRIGQVAGCCGHGSVFRVRKIRVIY
jgi:hypothetical protein